MKRFPIILATIIVSLCLVQAVAALTYEGQITVDPPAVNALKPGDPITEVSGTIKLPPNGDMTFASSDSLEFYTQLNNGKWEISIIGGGIEITTKSYGGRRATISGWELAYPLDNYEGGLKVKFSLKEGVVPPLFPSGDIILVRALELDSSSNQVGAGVYKNGTVINPAALQTQVDAMKAKLVELKTAMDEKEAMGVDTTVARQKYQAASDALTSAQTKLISAPAEVTGLLTRAGTAGVEGQEALDKAWAEMTIQQADTMIQSVNGLISEFKVNRSIKESDARLVPIINKYDLAARSLSDARNLLTEKSYTAVRTDAGQSLTYATDAWNLSVDLKTELEKGFSLPGLPNLPNLSAFLPIFLVAAVILIIVGVIIYRRKMKWDELG
jgi:hypothetical protein